MSACTFCPEPVDENDEETYHEVTSWVNGPKLDGPKMREQTGRFAHKACVDAVSHGQAPDQPKLDFNTARCDARAKKGTREGVCDFPLDEHGECPNQDNHFLR